MARIILMVDGVGSQQFELTDKDIHIGRAAHNDIHIDDLAVSSEHAVIEKVVDADFPDHVSYRIRDLDSTNNTFVNDIQIASKILQNNDLVRIGWSKFKYVDESEPSMDTTAYILPEETRHS